MGMDDNEVILSVDEITQTAKELHTRFAHWSNKWDELDTIDKRPYIRAASLMLTAHKKTHAEWLRTH